MQIELLINNMTIIETGKGIIIRQMNNKYVYVCMQAQDELLKYRYKAICLHETILFSVVLYN